MSFAIEDLKIFIENAPTSFHAAEQMAQRLLQKGYSPLDEKKCWHLERGRGYFVIRDGSFIAFTTPRSSIDSAVILASHTDSPALKLKPRPVVQKENMTFLSCDVYGAPLLSSWLNRDLTLAGKIVVLSNKGALQEHLIHLRDITLTLPQLAIHLDREVNDKGVQLNRQEHLKVLAGLDLEPNWTLEHLLKESIDFSDLLSFDLFLIPSQTPRYAGLHNELFSSFRIDNLASAHASLMALEHAGKGRDQQLQMIFAASHEEIGSKTPGGASGSFLQDVLSRLFASYHSSEEQRLCALARSLCVSIDMAHAFHPSYEGRFEPCHKPLLGKGVVIKYNAESRYATTSSSAAYIKSFCIKHKIPMQEFVARADMGCGSTIGPILATTLGMSTADIGIAQLSMHSAREIMAHADYQHLCSLLCHLITEDRG